MAAAVKSKRERSAVSRSRKSAEPHLAKDDLLQLYYYMRLTREFEDTIVTLYRQGKIVGGAFSGNGNEATAIGSAYCLNKEDYIFPMHRDLGAHFVKGQTVRNLMLQHLGRENSPARGRDGTGHYADPLLRIYGNISHLAAMIPVAAGVALACTLRKEHSVVMTYIGDGGSNVGDFHESLAMCSVMKLPLVLIVENNQFAYSTPIAKQFIVERLSDRAAGYGIPGFTIDGTDVEEVYTVCKQAVDRARKGEGPTLIESVTMRMHGHSVNDNAEYVPQKLLDGWKKKDPILKFEKQLIEKGILSRSIQEELGKKISDELDEATQFAVKSSYPAPQEATVGVFAE